MLLQDFILPDVCVCAGVCKWKSKLYLVYIHWTRRTASMKRLLNCGYGFSCWESVLWNKWSHLDCLSWSWKPWPMFFPINFSLGPTWTLGLLGLFFSLGLLSGQTIYSLSKTQWKVACWLTVSGTVGKSLISERQNAAFKYDFLCMTLGMPRSLCISFII